MLFQAGARTYSPRECEAHNLIEGPIINPTLVREMMVKTRDQGAVWDVPVWSIIDRAIQHDPAVWNLTVAGTLSASNG
jgi:hypothetical protein